MRVAFILILFSLPLMSKAQFQHGSQRIGADGNINYLSALNQSAIEGQVNLGYGYFIDNHLMIGIQAGIDLYSSKYLTSTSLSTRYSGGINMRRFFPINDGKYGFFVQGQAIFDYNTSTFKFSNITYHGRDIKDYRLAIAPGVFLFVSESNAFEFMFANLFYLKDLDASRSVVGFNSTTTSFLIGFHHYFNFPRNKVAVPKNMNRTN